jgi:hypothetical protein
MKYFCINCNQKFNKTFEEQQEKDKSASKLVRLILSTCPYCRGVEIYLTEHGRLLVERRAKINKIQNENQNNSKK